ncbi:MAG: SPFH domain-containing protein [Clostridiales bacterium]|jgi:membrane protease subunit (stomatin/prohibitin family)|nr:SPFH domain-containing protein [Clostridiales bacterium]
MGLIKAGLDAIGGTLADQWKEFVYCDALGGGVLASKGRKRAGKRSGNTKGDDNIISNGSVVAVADGQCMIIVEQGRVVEICAEPGEFTYDTLSEPSVFSGSLGRAVADSFESARRRFGFGGAAGKDQRVYFFNTKEIMDNKFGTSTPIPFRVVDDKIGLDIDVSVRCNGNFTYRLGNPLLFYANVCGNVRGDFLKSEISDTLRADILDALAPAFARVSDARVRPNQLAGQNTAIRDALREVLSGPWSERRGIDICSVSFNSVTIPKEDEELIKQAQRAAMLQNPAYAAATLAAAQADAMKTAAGNTGGAAMGFYGMNAARQTGGMNAENMFSLGMGQPRPASAPSSNSKAWVCHCGAVNKGRFCAECGSPKPASEPPYKCDKCGWEPDDPTRPPKFCPECGDAFNERDLR